MPEHGHERRIHVEESSGECAATNTEGGAQDERTGTGLGAAERFFIALVLDGRGQLLRNKFQNLAVALFRGTPSQSTDGAPISSASPRCTSSSKTSGVASRGSPVRRTYSVRPRP